MCWTRWDICESCVTVYYLVSGAWIYRLGWGSEESPHRGYKEMCTGWQEELNTEIFYSLLGGQNMFYSGKEQYKLLQVRLLHQLVLLGFFKFLNLIFTHLFPIYVISKYYSPTPDCIVTVGCLPPTSLSWATALELDVFTDLTWSGHCIVGVFCELWHDYW